VRRAVALAIAVALVTSACTSSQPTPPQSSTIVRTHTIVVSPPAPTPTVTFTPKPAATVDPLPPNGQPRRGERERRCPYIASTPEQDSKTNVADIDGSHVYRTTVLTRLHPVGCRFYFYAPPYEAIVDIVPRRFATATDAYNAMVRTADAGRAAMGHKNIVPGVDAVLYRTKFFGPDRGRYWACAFAAGRTMVIVHTQRDDTALNALLIARVVARQV
jgi:hypothetical protein